MPRSPTQIREERAILLSTIPQLVLMERRAHQSTFSTYGVEILSSTKFAESINCPSFKAFNSQQEISVEHRFMLVDFLIGILFQHNCSQTTLYSAVGIFDRYCSIRKVKKCHLKLLGLSCAWIASKYHDIKSRMLCLNDLIRYNDSKLDPKVFCEMEIHILSSLNWFVSFPTHDVFIDFYLNQEFFEGDHRRISNASDNTYYTFLKIGANFICEMSLMYPNVSFTHKPSKVTQVSLLILNNCYQFYFYDTFIEAPTDNTLFKLLLDCFKYRFPSSFHSKHFDYSAAVGRESTDIHLIYNCIIAYYKKMTKWERNLVKTPRHSIINSPSPQSSVFTSLNSPSSDLTSPESQQSIVKKRASLQRFGDIKKFKANNIY